MENLLYISVGIIAIAFVFLVIYLIKTLKTLSTTLHNISNTVTSLDNKITGVAAEAEQLLHKTNVLADDIKQKSEKLNSVVESVAEVGTTIQNFNSSLSGISKTIVREVEKNQERISQIVQIGNIAVELKEKWDEIKLRKKQEKEAKLRIEKQFESYSE